MYNYISAIAINKQGNGEFVPVDIQTKKLNSLWVDYEKVWVTLSHPAAPSRLYLDIDLLDINLRYSIKTFGQFLIDNANTTLPTVTVEPNTAFKTVRYHDMWSSDFKIRTSNVRYHPTVPVYGSDATDLLLSKNAVVYKDVVEHGLFSVAGYIHRADYTEHGIYVLNGAVTALAANSNMIGYLNFKTLGKVSTYSFSTEHLVEAIKGKPMSETVYVKSPVNLAGKTPMLVVGGHLYPVGFGLSYFTDNVLAFDFTKYPWLDRLLTLMETMGGGGNTPFIDFNELRLANGSIEKDKIYSNATLTALFLHYSTFLVVVDNPKLYVGYSELPSEGLIGKTVVHHDKRFTKPLVTTQGRIAEYTRIAEEGHQLLTFVGTVVSPVTAEFTDWEKPDNQVVPYMRSDVSSYTELSRVRALTIGTAL